MTQDFTKFFPNFWMFSCYWFSLNSYNNILTLIAPTGFKKTFIGSYVKFSEKNAWFNWLRHSPLALFYWFFGFCLNIYCYFHSLKTYWLGMPDIHICPLIEVTERIYWHPLKATEFNRCQNLKKKIRKFFWTLTHRKLIFVNCKSVSVMSGLFSVLRQSKYV